MQAKLSENPFVSTSLLPKGQKKRKELDKLYVSQFKSKTKLMVLTMLYSNIQACYRVWGLISLKNYVIHLVVQISGACDITDSDLYNYPTYSISTSCCVWCSSETGRLKLKTHAFTWAEVEWIHPPKAPLDNSYTWTVDTGGF